MTALYMDGFDHYGGSTVSVNNMLAGSWANVSATVGVPSFGARTGSFALGVSSVSNLAAQGTRYVLPTTETDLFLSMGYGVAALPSSNFAAAICTFNDNANNLIAVLWCQSTGALTLSSAQGGGTVFATTQGPVITSGAWHLLEMNFNYSAGSFTLRVDDPGAGNTPAITATSLTFGGASAPAQMVFNNNIAGQLTWIDDLFIRNASGSVNNSWLGDRRVATLLADGNGTSQGWTPNYYQVLGSAGILNNTASNAGVSTATSTSLDIGAADFTLETFVRFQSLPTGSNPAVIFNRWDATANQRSYQLFLGSVALNGGALCFQESVDGTTVTQPIVYPWTPQLNAWYHVAVVRASNQLLLFVNGSQLGLPISDAHTYFAGSSPFSLGVQYQASGLVTNTSVDGWFNGTRFTNGFARYTSNFTVPTTEYPTGSGDTHWADVVLYGNYDSLNLIQDISSFGRTLTARNNAVQQPVNDGPSVGAWSAVGKSVPDDNTFIEAPFVAATSILTVTVNPSNGNTVTVGTKDGTTAAVYTFKTALAAAFDVLIDTNIQNTLQNLYNAINAGPGSGTKYGTSTTSNFDVNALQLPAGQMQVIANAAGTTGNSIATSKSGITGAWTGTTLSGGLNIPGPSTFSLQRLPPTTTIISAVQVSTRAFKSDAGLGSINSALIGPLGGVAAGSTHSLTIAPTYYNDIFETDPDTSGPISPTTITNGAIEINRDT